MDGIYRNFFSFQIEEHDTDHKKILPPPLSYKTKTWKIIILILDAATEQKIRFLHIYFSIHSAL